MLSRAASAAAVISTVALVLAAISGYFVNLQEKRAEDLNAEVATLRNTVTQLNSSMTQLSGRLQDIEVKVKNLSQSASQLSNQIIS